LPASATRIFQTESLTLNADAKTPLEVDGELVGHLPATFSLRRSHLRLIVP